MFSARDAFDQFHEANGEHCSYDAMRGEIAGDYLAATPILVFRHDRYPFRG